MITNILTNLTIIMLLLVMFMYGVIQQLLSELNSITSPNFNSNFRFYWYFLNLVFIVHIFCTTLPKYILSSLTINKPNDLISWEGLTKSIKVWTPPNQILSTKIHTYKRACKWLKTCVIFSGTYNIYSGSSTNLEHCHHHRHGNDCLKNISKL